MDAPSQQHRFLSPAQRRIVGFALSFAAVLGIVVLLVASVVALGRLVSFFAGVFGPLAMAGVLALIMLPVVELVERRLRWRRIVAVAAFYALFVCVMVGFGVLLLPPLIDQLLNFIAYVPTLWESATRYLEGAYPEWVAIVQRQLENPTLATIAQSLTSELDGLLVQALPSLRAAGIGILGLFGSIAQLAVVPVYLFFFLLSRGAPTRHVPEHLGFLRPSLREDVVFLLNEFIAIVVAFFRGQLLIALLMGVMLATGFSLVGLRFGLFIGLTLGILNIVPYLGTIIGLAITVPLAFFQPGGGWQLVGLVLLVYLIVQNIEGWILTPKIMGERTGLHPVVVIVSIFFWGTAFGGILGMLFAIPLTAFFVTLWRLIRRKYFGTQTVEQPGPTTPAAAVED
ncbi:AI-2E family transporter [Cephaloticoccus primus]|uniref:AI-2E family transporter n=1 Tax=Cephaloticoccus primus TaxID=1548207 RepID=UPI0008388FFF|nr:AI-2E family transporter [Cephaloticoccus primus]